jgi:uncharacterized protein YdeI (YjbR/CyaY-like superfamily)
MEVATTFKAADRAAWCEWLEQNHAAANEIWLIFDDRDDVPSVSYLHAVEEAICFGWIDSLQKRINPNQRAQRLSPRKPRGKWTELNKARARRLIRLGLMTEAGRAVLPDLEAPFLIAQDIQAALQAEPGAWENLQAFPELYRRVRISNIEDVRKSPIDFERRLNLFVKKCVSNEMYGRWDDGGWLSEEYGDLDYE